MNTASFDKDRAQFETSYAAANPLVVVASDIDPEDVRTRADAAGHTPRDRPHHARHPPSSPQRPPGPPAAGPVYNAPNVTALRDPYLPSTT